MDQFDTSTTLSINPIDYAQSSDFIKWVDFFKTTLPQGSTAIIEGVLVPLITAALLGFIIRFVYQQTWRAREKFSRDICNSIPVLSMIVTLVIIAIGGNLVHAVSLLGTLALIRFRTRIKSVHDMSYIFLVVAVSIAIGLRAYAVAIIGTALILFVFGVLHVAGRTEKAA